ncbi:MFS transporter, partial [Burkholderia multivorans]|nr:MFS transporter [Burkholderia multivorans]
MTISQVLRAGDDAPHADAPPTGRLAAEDYAASERTLAKAFRRILPFIFVCYVISYLDRTNVGFAALTMNMDLGLTA